MSYKIIIDKKQDYIRVEVSGARRQGKEVKDAISVWSQVADCCRAKGVSLVLGILNLNGRLPTMASYNIASSPDAFGWCRSFRLACVDLNEKSRYDNLFTEDVAVNRGYQFKIFDNEQAAKAWLFNFENAISLPAQ